VSFLSCSLAQQLLWADVVDADVLCNKPTISTSVLCKEACTVKLNSLLLLSL
jgi:hypothetical protein